MTRAHRLEAQTSRPLRQDGAPGPIQAGCALAARDDADVCHPAQHVLMVLHPLLHLVLLRKDGVDGGVRHATEQLRRQLGRLRRHCDDIRLPYPTLPQAGAPEQTACGFAMLPVAFMHIHAISKCFCP